MEKISYNRTPKGAYIRQKANARRRGIPWGFTYESWWKIWEESGKWEERGRTSSSYVMSRIDDEGHYGPGNVEIKTMRDNTKEYLDKKWCQDDPWAPYERTSGWQYRWKGITYGVLGDTNDPFYTE